MYNNKKENGELQYYVSSQCLKKVDVASLQKGNDWGHLAFLGKPYTV